MTSFVQGLLAPERRREVLRHIDECEACRALAAALAADSDAGSVDADEVREPVPSASDLETGEVIADRFVLGKELGHGAVGTVFRAFDRKLQKEVALKLMRHESSKTRQSALARELNAGRKVQHPNVCRLYDAGSTGDFDFITMELVEGVTLAQSLANEEPTLERALEILRGIAAGLGAAHARGIVHRDVKPANVLIERGTNRVVLTDFGFAADLDSQQSRRLVGTPAYWAPEQARGEPPTAACDVYSFGVLAYRLLAGRDFSLSDPNALSHVPSRQRRAVARCVDAKPTARFAHANEAGAAFDAPLPSRWPYYAAAAAAILAVYAVSGRSAPPASPAPPGPSVAPQVVEAKGVPTSAQIDPAPPSHPPAPPPPSSPESISSAPAATFRPAAHPPVVTARPSIAPPPSAASSPAPPRPSSDLLFRE